MRSIVSILTALVFSCVALSIELDSTNFDKVVHDPTKSTFVKFYASWCSHCKKMEPDWEALSQSYEGNDQIQFVEIDGDKNKEQAKAFNVGGFPTLLLFKQHDLANPIKYEGSRDAESMANFIEANTGLSTSKVAVVSKVTQLDDGSFERMVTKKKRSSMMLFVSEKGDKSECETCQKSWETLAEAFHPELSKIIVGEVNKEGDEPVDMLLRTFNVKKFPTVVFVPSGRSQDAITYTGSCNVDELVDFVNEHIDTRRTATGGLQEGVGTIPEMHDHLKKYVAASRERRAKMVDDVIDELKKVNDTMYREEIKFYAKLITVLLGTDGESYIESEKKRLAKVHEDPGIAKEFQDAVEMKENLLKVCEEALKNFPENEPYTPTGKRAILKSSSRSARLASEAAAAESTSSKDEL